MGHLNNVKKVFISVMFLSFFFLGNVYAAEKDLMCSEKNLLKIDLSPEDVRIFSEWDEHFSYILKQNLWSKTNIYDTGHYMMVPLHVAFFADDIKMIKDFSDQFHLFMKFLDGRSVASTGAGTQNNAQYIYMASRFIWLATFYGYEQFIPTGLEGVVKNFVFDYFFKPGKWWKGQPYSMNMGERFNFIVSNERTEYKWYKTIPDLNLFITAIAADLLSVEKERKEKHDSVAEKKLKHIMEKFYSLMRHEVVFIGKGNRWLLQPGVLSDHSDYIYAGYDNFSKISSPKPISDIVSDSSHFHRMSLFILSWSGAFKEGSEQKLFFERLRIGLKEQLLHVVLISPSAKFPFYRLTNYMDGNNGLYRYNYETNGLQKGTLPYQLSGTFLLGWWAFLKDAEVSQIYNDIYHMFPLSKAALQCYVGANTTRKRHPAYRAPDCFLEGGICRILVYFASLINIAE